MKKPAKKKVAPKPKAPPQKVMAGFLSPATIKAHDLRPASNLKGAK